MNNHPEPFARPAPPAEEQGRWCASARVLCLGNELLADDALGSVVAEHLRRLTLPGVDVVDTSVTGFHLLDHILNVRRLLVIDTILTGTADPGTVFLLREEDVRAVPGGSPHYIGLFEALAVGRKLGLAVPEEVAIIAVEAADCCTVGGRMHPSVLAAVPTALNLALEFLGYLNSKSTQEGPARTAS